METTRALARATRVGSNKEDDGEGCKSDGDSGEDGNGNGRKYDMCCFNLEEP
jgi:hypothetical protein